MKAAPSCPRESRRPPRLRGEPLPSTHGSRFAAARRAATALLLLAAGCTTRLERLPAKPAELASCQAQANCVSSLATDPAQHVDPIPYTGDHVEAMRRLRKVIEAMPHASVVDFTDMAVRAEFANRVVCVTTDTVEAVIDPDAHVIEIRSKSRLGNAVGRERADAIRAAFAESQAESDSAA